MPSKSKRGKKKQKISKHVLQSREQNPTEEGAGTAPTTREIPPKQRQSKAQQIKAPIEAANYLAGWKSKKENDTPWKFNKNTQSWLIRHMYEVDKIDKTSFSLLLEYLAGLEGATTRSRMKSEANRRALRYREYEKKATTEDAGQEPNTTSERSSSSKTPDTEAKDQQSLSTFNDIWNGLSDHDRRKEYKRARKILEILKD